MVRCCRLISFMSTWSSSSAELNDNKHIMLDSKYKFGYQSFPFMNSWWFRLRADSSSVFIGPGFFSNNWLRKRIHCQFHWKNFITALFSKIVPRKVIQEGFKLKDSFRVIFFLFFSFFSFFSFYFFCFFSFFFFFLFFFVYIFFFSF